MFDTDFREGDVFTLSLGELFSAKFDAGENIGNHVQLSDSQIVWSGSGDDPAPDDYYDLIDADGTRHIIDIDGQEVEIVLVDPDGNVTFTFANDILGKEVFMTAAEFAICIGY